MCKKNNKTDKIEKILEEKKKIIQISNENRGKPLDDLKSSSGEIYNMLKQELSLTQCANNVDSFMRDTLAPLITSDMQIYKELKENIIERILKTMK